VRASLRFERLQTIGLRCSDEAAGHPHRVESVPYSLDVDAHLAAARERVQGQVAGVGHVEPQVRGVGSGEGRLAVRSDFDADGRRLDLQISGQ
jgi:hypothetical protein